MPAMQVNVPPPQLQKPIMFFASISHRFFQFNQPSSVFCDVRGTPSRSASKLLTASVTCLGSIQIFDLQRPSSSLYSTVQ